MFRLLQVARNFLDEFRNIFLMELLLIGYDIFMLYWFVLVLNIDVCGSSRLPTYSDRDKMPFTEAVIMEMQRLYTVAPMGRNTFSFRL